MKIKPNFEKNEIKIKFVTRMDTRTNEFYYSFMDPLLNKYPQFMPEFYGWNPKCKAPFEGVEEGKSLGRWSLLGARDKEKYQNPLGQIL